MNTYHFGYSVHYTVEIEAESLQEATEKLPDMNDWVRERKPMRLLTVDLDTDGGGSPNDD